MTLPLAAGRRIGFARRILIKAIDDDMLTELEYVSTSSSILIPGEIFSICKRTGTVSLTSIPNGC
ncbi:hypothetical protein L210DRAFT_950824 [Boletus edulis BED1]|uniref:Uncharacterized protein n=1 Tax=Boletus edulis BED1 TaxID=1328754 RepID=A0AAD4BMB0_BOLED|nr:hypothetical protein L210DRAFT_950824 [Boletus edulis BED1]